MSGLCECGCGQRTSLVTKSNRSKGLVAGTYRRFATGHSVRARWLHHLPEYVERDCGYETPCWIWQRALDQGGYGSVAGGKAYRLYYERARGPIPVGLDLDHLCRTRACVNPDHLEPVTRAENCRRGLGTKLTADQVRAIRAEPTSRSNRALAAVYGVSNVQIHKIRTRQSWRDLA